MGRDVSVGTLVATVDRSFAQRFPTLIMHGRPPVSTRVLLALEILKQELTCSDEQICSRLRTDLAVMYACGITEVQVDGSQEYFVLPEVLAQCRRRLDKPLMEEWLAIQAATAMEDGLVSPAHLGVDTFPVSRAANVSMMRPRGIRPKKSPPGHHVHNRPVRHPGHRAAGAATPAGPCEAYAPLRPPVSGDR